MDLLTDIMRLMHPGGPGSEPASSPRRRSLDSNPVRYNVFGDAAPAQMSADESSDPTNTARPLSSTSSTAGE